jgi:glucosamine-6-phosphate deaminase
MEIVILPDNQAIGSLGADAVEDLLRRKPDAVLGLATGSSPLAIYDELAHRYSNGRLSFAEARGFTLDEYVGLPADHPESYRNVIDKDFVSRVDFAEGAVQGPDGLAQDIPAACAGYEEAIARAGGGRPADPGHRHRRPHRLQRTRLLAGLADPHQDPDQADPARQRPVLR